MTDAPDGRRGEFTVTLKEMGGILLFFGTMVSGWVSLNNSQVETDTKLKAFESYYRDSLKEYKSANEKSLMEVKLLIVDQKKLGKDLSDQVDGLERSVTQMYRMSRKP
jgi:hypothetical protein